MPEPMTPESLNELASIIRQALRRADELNLTGVGIELDAALIKLAGLDETGSVQPEPYSLPYGDEVDAA